MSIRASSRPVVFLDRDGTLIHDAHYLTDPNQVRLYQDVPEAIRLLRRAGYKLVVVTNQSGIGRGWVTPKVVTQINRRMQDLLRARCGVSLDGIYFCPHAPWDDCHCRKPKPGLIHAAKRRLRLQTNHAFMIGDKVIDILLGKRFKMKSVFLLTGHGRKELIKFKRLQPAFRPNFIAKRFSQAVQWILKS